MNVNGLLTVMASPTVKTSGLIVGNIRIVIVRVTDNCMLGEPILVHSDCVRGSNNSPFRLCLNSETCIK